MDVSASVVLLSRMVVYSSATGSRDDGDDYSAVSSTAYSKSLYNREKDEESMSFFIGRDRVVDGMRRGQRLQSQSSTFDLRPCFVLCATCFKSDLSVIATCDLRRETGKRGGMRFEFQIGLKFIQYF